jgi:3',5'-cyclic AMP phosphodiesterase CpdA
MKNTKLYMSFTVRNSQSILIVAGLFLLIFVFTGCQDEHIFRYGTAKPRPFGSSFLVIGDSRSGDRIYMDMIDSMTSSFSSSSCLINVGDMIKDPGNKAQWRRFLEITAPLAEIMPWYGTVGNHDVNSIASQQIYQEVMDFPGNEMYYSFDRIDSHFIVLDTEVPGQVGGIVGEQLAWLRNDLQTYADSTQYLFVFTHRPVYPQGHYRGHDLANADELHQLFTHYGVDTVFSGHEHQYYIYQKDSMHYVVTGGGGAPIYTGGIGESFHHYLLVEILPPNRILIHVLDVQGREIQTDVITTN